jgi:DNA polymerase-3 subunit delta
MEIKSRNIEPFLRSPPPAVLAVLIHGEDAGLVRERADKLCASIVPDKGDPFRLVDLDAGDITGDPARLADEAASIAMMGGRRVIRIRRAGDSLNAAFSAFLKAPLGDALFILEGAILAKRSTLRSTFEGHERAAAIACYADSLADIEDLIQTTLRAHQLTIEPAAMEMLARRLGGDRMASRNELDKLILYIGSASKTVTRADVLASSSDTSEADNDDIVDAAAEGDTAKLDRLLARAFDGGASAVMLVRAAQTHITRLHQLTAQAQAGRQIDSLVRGLKPGLPYPRVDRVIRQAKTWSNQRLGEMIRLLNEAEIDCKTTGLPDQAIAARALMGIALRARSRG